MSLSSGQKINKVYLYDKFFPLPFTNKYIVFAPHSKDSKNYDYWQNVLNILSTFLEKEGIKIVQVGAGGERPYAHCYHTMGQTNINQISFLVKNSIGVLSTDTFVHHIADAFGVKSVMLCSNNYVNNVRGYFNPGNQIVIESPKEPNEKPCLSLQENPKSINKIKSEDIAKSVCKMLGISYSYEYDTVFLGDISHVTMIESSCDHVVNHNQFGIPSIIMRMDYNFNEQVLINQMQICEVSIVTNKIVNINILNHFKPRIKEIVYIIEDKSSADANWAKSVINTGIPFKILSTMSAEDINSIKLDFWEIGIIHHKPKLSAIDCKSLNDKPLDKLFFKSSKFVIGKGKLYPSKASYLQDKSINDFDAISPIIDHTDFWDDMQSYRILEKV